MTKLTETRSLRRSLLSVLCCLIASRSIASVYGHSMILVDSGRPKCMTVEVPGHTVVRIVYEAPDVQRKTKHGTVGPTYITLLEKPTDTIQDKMGDAERIAQRRIQMQERNKHKLKPVSQELKDVKGSFLQRIHQDAAVDICIRASMAGSTNPMRFHLRIEELGDDEASAEELEQNALGAEQHWSFLETQMNRIEHEMHAIIAGVDFFKERDAIYHQQTDEMHKATTFWPILHVSILLITGFTQANHIVRFFQSRRII